MCERDETAPQSTGCCQGPTALHTGFVLFLSEQNPPGHLELSPGAGPRAELVLWDLLQVTNIQQLQRTGCERQGPAHRSGDDAVTNKKKGTKRDNRAAASLPHNPVTPVTPGAERAPPQNKQRRVYPASASGKAAGISARRARLAGSAGGKDAAL